MIPGTSSFADRSTTQRLLLTYYGDDFTGSTDVMEALALHGVKTVLFTGIPADSEYRQFTDYHAVGLAGTSRAELAGPMRSRLAASFPGALIHVCTDLDLSLAAAGDGPAVVLIAGTGSAAIGRDEKGRLVLADEAFTPDSSRFWPADEFEPGRSQASFDKQYVRDYCESLGWDKTYPGPELPEDVVAGTRARYVEAFELLTEIRFDDYLASPRVALR